MKKKSQKLTIKKVSKMLAVGEKTVYRLAKKGSIPAIKIKEKWCFEFSILNQWIQKNITKF